MVHGPVREVVRGSSPLDWSMDWESVFSGHPPKQAWEKDKARISLQLKPDLSVSFLNGLHRWMKGEFIPLGILFGS